MMLVDDRGSRLIQFYQTTDLLVDRLEPSTDYVIQIEDTGL